MPDIGEIVQRLIEYRDNAFQELHEKRTHLLSEAASAYEAGRIAGLDQAIEIVKTHK